MPNYLYRCTFPDCDHSETITLPISSDPKAAYTCAKCLGDMTRRMSKPTVTQGRQTLGKWYKEQTGKDLLGDKC